MGASTTNPTTSCYPKASPRSTITSKPPTYSSETPTPEPQTPCPGSSKPCKVQASVERSLAVPRRSSAWIRKICFVLIYVLEPRSYRFLLGIGIIIIVVIVILLIKNNNNNNNDNNNDSNTNNNNNIIIIS